MYSILAEYYDYIYSFYQKEYVPRQVEFITELFNGRNIEVVLDLACGTAYPTQLLAEKGYQVICLDISREVLGIARKRLSSYIADLVEADMLYIPLRSSSIDAATVLFSSVQYIGPLEKLEKLAENIYRVLRDNSILIFDAHNPIHPREERRYPVVWDTPGPRGEHLLIVDYSETKSLRQERVLKRVITIIKPGGETKTILSVDKLYLYSPGEYKLVLKHAGFRKVDLYGSYSRDTRSASSSSRVVVVAEK